jgi:hypothetical protein
LRLIGIALGSTGKIGEQSKQDQDQNDASGYANHCGNNFAITSLWRPGGLPSADVCGTVVRVIHFQDR